MPIKTGTRNANIAISKIEFQIQGRNVCLQQRISETLVKLMMNSTTDVKDLELNKLEWTLTSCKVSEFLRRFDLPQIVKVIEGFYGDDEDSSLGADQVLVLHCVKSTEKVVGRDYRGKEVNIPLNCPNKVEVRPSDFKDVYESVEELCKAFPRYVRISQGYYSPSTDEEVLNVGDKLYLKSIDKSKKGEEKLICVNQNGQTIELPKDCTAGFQPLADGKEYHLSEVITQFSMPVYVQFVDPPIMGKQSRMADATFFNSSLGPIYLESSYIENIIIASTTSQDGHRTVVTFPREMDIRLAVCEGLLQNTPAYTQKCKSLNSGMDLQNLKSIDAVSAFKPRNSVREFSYNELIDPSNINTSEWCFPLEEEEIEPHKEEEIEPHKEVEKPQETSQKPEEPNHKLVVNQKPELNQSPDYENEDWAQKMSKNQESLEKASGDGTCNRQRLEKPQRTINSLQKNGQGQQAESKNDSSSTSSQSDDNDVPRVEVTSEDSEIAIKRVDVSHYTVKQVSEILKELGMDRYIVKFEAEMIDGEMLMCLENDILITDFGMNKLHCMKLKKYLEGWRPKV